MKSFRRVERDGDFCDRAGIHLGGEQLTILLNDERLVAPFVHTEHTVGAVGQRDGLEFLHLGRLEERENLGEDEDENPQHGGDDQRSADLDEDRS